MADKYRVDHRSTEQQVIDLIESGVDKHRKPMNFGTFEKKSNRRMELFFKEIRKGVVLELDPVTMHVDRLTYGIRFIMYEILRRLVWREVMRGWPNGVVIPKFKESTVSETCELIPGTLPGELVLEPYDDTALRCLIQELRHLWRVWGYTPTKKDLMQIATHTPEQARLLERVGCFPTLLLPNTEHESVVDEGPYWSTTWYGLRTRTKAKWYPYFLDLNDPSFSLAAMSKKGVHFFKDIDDDSVVDGRDPERNAPDANWVEIHLLAEEDKRPSLAGIR